MDGSFHLISLEGRSGRGANIRRRVSLRIVAVFKLCCTALQHTLAQEGRLALAPTPAFAARAVLTTTSMFASRLAATGLSAVLTAGAAALASAYLGVGDPAGEGCLG